MLTRIIAPVAALAAVLALGTAAPAQELKETSFPNAAHHQKAAYRTDTIKLTLAAAKAPRRGNETEYSVWMNPGDTLVYSLTMPEGSDVYLEFHGHDDKQVSFYKKESGVAHHGSLTAPFEGDHGWFLENRSAKPVEVELKLSGFYEVAPEE
jgi:hypothetical protein